MLSKLNDLINGFVDPATVESHRGHALQLATAVLLIEVMQSDFDSTDQEHAVILKILKDRFHLSDPEVAKLSEQGKQSAKHANDFHQFTSLINRELGPDEKIRIIEYMWQVAYADDRISAHENHLMRKIASLLYIPHDGYIAAKMRAKPAHLK